MRHYCCDFGRLAQTSLLECSPLIQLFFGFASDIWSSNTYREEISETAIGRLDLHNSPIISFTQGLVLFFLLFLLLLYSSLYPVGLFAMVRTFSLINRFSYVFRDKYVSRYIAPFFQACFFYFATTTSVMRKDSPASNQDPWPAYSSPRYICFPSSCFWDFASISSCSPCPM